MSKLQGNNAYCTVTSMLPLHHGARNNNNKHKTGSNKDECKRNTKSRKFYDETYAQKIKTTSEKNQAETPAQTSTPVKSIAREKI